MLAISLLFAFRHGGWSLSSSLKPCSFPKSPLCLSEPSLLTNPPQWGTEATVLPTPPPQLLFLLPLSACPAELLLSHVSLPSLSSFQTLQAHESQSPGSFCCWHCFVLPPNDAAQKDHENTGQERVFWSLGEPQGSGQSRVKYLGMGHF